MQKEKSDRATAAAARAIEVKQRNGWYTIANKDQKHYVNGKLHSVDDQPAIITKRGDKYWYKNGRLHRDNGSAIEYANCTRVFEYKDGKFIDPKITRAQEIIAELEQLGFIVKYKNKRTKKDLQIESK